VLREVSACNRAKLIMSCSIAILCVCFFLQEVEPTIGEALCRLFPADDNIDINHIVHSAKQALRKLERGTGATGTSGGGGAAASSQARPAVSKSPTSSSSRSDMFGLFEGLCIGVGG